MGRLVFLFAGWCLSCWLSWFFLSWLVGILSESLCPFKGCDGCNSEVGRGLTKKYFIDHLGSRHFECDDLKACHKACIKRDFCLFFVLRQCMRKVSDGHLTVAVRILTLSGVAPKNEETLGS